jgi:anti-anti-sigma factor
VIDDTNPRPLAGNEATAGQPMVSSEPGAVQVLVGEDRVRIVLSGDVDSDLGDDLVEAATEAERHDLPIEVDAHHVTFMDSAGVAFLARLSIRSKHRVRLLRVPPTVKFLLEVTRIGELVDVAGDDEAAPFRPLAEPQQ